MSTITDQIAGVSDPAFPLVVNSKLDATADPTVNDDSADGYSVGSLWVRVDTAEAWLLTDKTVGAAVWTPIVGPAVSGSVGPANSPAAGEWAKFVDGDSIEGRTTAELISDAGLLTAAAAALAYQPLDASLTAHAALTTAANKGVYYSGADTPVTYDLTSFGRTFAGYADAATAFGNIKQAASESATGVVELATTAEAQAGTDTSRAITAAGLRASTRELLTGNRTYYVRTDGSDSNNGLANTAGGAFLTIQKAVDVACALDLGIYAVTIEVGDGTYTGAVVLKNYIGVGPITLDGNTGAPASCVISTTSADAIAADAVPRKWVITGFKLQTATSGFAAAVKNGSYVSFGAMEYGAVAAGYFHLYADDARIDCTASYTISGGGGVHYGLFHQGIIVITTAITVTVSGTPAFSTAFVQCDRLSMAQLAQITFAGSATGPRFRAQMNSVIYTNGGGATYFPGDSAGSSATGAQYT